MSLSVTYYLPRKLSEEDKERIRKLGSDIRFEDLTTKEAKALMVNPVRVEENNCGPSTEVFIGNYISGSDFYVPATKENLSIIKKIQDIVLKE